MINNMKQTTTTLMVALACFACMSANAAPQPDKTITTPNGTVTILAEPSIPNSFTFTWSVEGWMVGNCDIAIGATGAIWYQQAPPNAYCGTHWHYEFGPFVSSGENCKSSFSYPWHFYERPRTGGAWEEMFSFKWSDFVSGCCQQFPPQSCNGVFNVLPLACEDSCGPRPAE